MLKGVTHSGTVVHMAVNVRHIDRSIKEPMLAQACGMSGRAVTYLSPYGEAEPVTCKRCLKIIEAKGLIDPATTPEDDMTTVVAKGANRPAAAKRTAKAAQRTALPPKPGAVQDAKDAISESAPSLPKTGAKRAPRAKKATFSSENEMVNHANAEAKKAQAKPPQTRQTSRAELLASRKVATPKPASKPLPPKGKTPHEKAEELVAQATEAGWVAAAEKGETAADLVTFKAVRDGETVTLHWITGGTRPGTHSNGGRNVQAMNAATVRRILTTPAEAAAKVRTAYASGKGKAKRQAVKVASSGSLPFSTDGTDAEVLAALQGRTLTWTNSISGEPETATVGGKGKTAPKMTGEGDKRAIAFSDIRGFRTARLTSITSVN